MNTTHQIHNWSPIRNLIADHLSVASRKNMIHSLIEIDITDVLRKLKEKQKEEQVGYSINAYILYILCQSLKKHKELLAMRKGRNKLVVFDEIDLLVVVEKRLKKQQSIPMATIMRGACQLTFKEMNDLLRHYQKADPMDIPGIKERRALMRYPSWIRKWMFHRIDRNPFLQKKIFGTAAVTALTQKSDYKQWWGIPITAAPITLLPSSIHKKVVLNNQLPEERDYLSFTVTANHDTIDGGPLKRFFAEFIDIFEKGYGI